MSIYPNDKECIAILKEAGCKKRVMIHCCTVRSVADEMVKGFDADTELVTAGALLHDIGRSVDHTIRHAMIGAGIAEGLGLPKEIIEIIRKHTGAGLDEMDIREFSLPNADYIPRTIEEKIVAHADNLVSDDRVVPHSHSAEKLRRKGSERGAVKIERLHSELSAIYGKDLDCLVDVLGEYPEFKGPCSALGKRS